MLDYDEIMRRLRSEFEQEFQLALKLGWVSGDRGSFNFVPLEQCKPLDQARQEALEELKILKGATGSDTTHSRDNMMEKMLEALGPDDVYERKVGEKLTSEEEQLLDRILNGYNLTPQQRKVSIHVANGLTNKEIAEKMQRKVKTVKFHLTRVFQSVTPENRLKLGIWCRGLVGEAKQKAVAAAVEDERTFVAQKDTTEDQGVIPAGSTIVGDIPGGSNPGVGEANI